MSATLSLTVSETSTNPSANTSVVKATLKITASGDTRNEYSPSGYIIIDGTKYSFSHGFSRNTTTTLATKSKTVSHNADGTKSVTVKASFSTGVSVGTLTKTVTKTLTAFTRSFTITFNVNGGSGSNFIQTKTYGTALTLSKKVPTKTGSTFLGWSTKSSSTAADSAYTAAKMAAGVSYTSNAALTLYAIWKINTYTITYNANGGSGAPGKQTKTYGKVLKLSAVKPSKTGSNFSGWRGSDGNNYTPGANYSTNANLILTAQWNVITYIIKYNANGGSGAPGDQTKNYGQNLTLSNTVPTKTSYRFLGWSTNINATSPTWTKGGTYKDNKSVTLYAIWANTYIGPSIASRRVYRSLDDTGSIESLAGAYIYLSFDWIAGSTNAGANPTTVTIKKGSATVYNESFASESGTVSIVFDDVPVGETAAVTITVTDTGTSPAETDSETFNLPTGGYVMHIGRRENNITFFGTADDDVDGVVIGKGNMLLYDGSIYLSGRIYPNDNNVQVIGASGRRFNYAFIRWVQLGTSDPTIGAGVNCYWADGSLHNLVDRAVDGKTTYIGWAGSSSYPTEVVSRTDFRANGDITANGGAVSASKVTAYTPSWSSGQTPVRYSCVVSAGICHLSYMGAAVAHSANTSLGTLLVGSRPKSQVEVPFIKMSGGVVGVISISTAGAITVAQISNTTNTGRIYFNCSFPVV